MLTAFVIVVLLLAAGLGYQYFTRTPAQVTTTGTGVSAFARLAEADGKIIALKAGAEAKKIEALAASAIVEEIHKITG